MKIQLTEQEIRLKEKKGLFEYKLNNIKVEGFSTRSEALKHAQDSFTEFISKKYLKQK